MIEPPADLVQGDDQWAIWHKACKSESPAWGYEGEGEQCQRQPGHEGPHYMHRLGECVIQWEYAPGQDWHLERMTGKAGPA